MMKEAGPFIPPKSIISMTQRVEVGRKICVLTIKEYVRRDVFE